MNITDIASAFPIILVHPDDHEFWGIQFKGAFIMTDVYS